MSYIEITEIECPECGDFMKLAEEGYNHLKNKDFLRFACKPTESHPRCEIAREKKSVTIFLKKPAIPLGTEIIDELMIAPSELAQALRESPDSNKQYLLNRAAGYMRAATKQS